MEFGLCGLRVAYKLTLLPFNRGGFTFGHRRLFSF